MKTSLPARLLALRDRMIPLLHFLLPFALRLLFGWQFFVTGRGKLLHLERTTEFFASIPLPAPGFHAVLVGTLECIGGLLLLAGLGTRLVSAALAGTLVVAYLTAHRAEAFTDIDAFMAAAPFPYLLATLTLLAFGPGRLSLDAPLARRFGDRACPATQAAA